jgi:hypothetical protein
MSSGSIAVAIRPVPPRISCSRWTPPVRRRISPILRSWRRYCKWPLEGTPAVREFCRDPRLATSRGQRDGAGAAGCGTGEAINHYHGLCIAVTITPSLEGPAHPLCNHHRGLRALRNACNAAYDLVISSYPSVPAISQPRQYIHLTYAGPVFAE